MAKRNQPTELPKGFHRQKLSPFIWAEVTVEGQRHRFSCKTADLRDAILERDRQYKKLLVGHKADTSKTTIEELCQNYIAHLETLAAARGDYAPDTAYNTLTVVEAHLYRLLGKGTIASKLTTKNVADYRTRRLKETGRHGRPITPHTVDKELGILRTAVNIGAAAKPSLIDASVFPKKFWGIDKANTESGIRDGVITLEHFDMLEPHMPEYMKPMLITCLLIGVRKREARFIKRSQLLENRQIKLEAGNTKKNRTRIAQLPMKAWDLVSRWDEKTRLEYPHCPYLFHFNGKQIATKTLDDAFNRACLAAGLAEYRKDEHGTELKDARRCKIVDKKIHWHDSRRGFTTMAGSLEGVTDTDRGRVAGQTAATIARYDKGKSAVKVADAIDKMIDGGKAHKVVTIAPVAPVSDWKAELKELKAMLDDGTFTAEEFATEKARVLTSRV